MTSFSLKKLRNDSVIIFESCLQAVDPHKLVRDNLFLDNEILTAGGNEYRLADYSSIYVVGAGKASAAMGKAVESILGERITDGYVITKYCHGEKCDKIRIREAAHPVPDWAGVEYTQELLQLTEKACDTDLVIALISGGGSALLCAPAEGIGLKEKQETTSALLKCGADIVEMNTIRKHLSAVKGGQLARSVFPAEMIVLILSDVVGDPLDSIASGPTAYDSATFDDCLEIIARYNLESRLWKNVMEHLRRGAKDEIPETPKKGNTIFEKVHNRIIGNNRFAVDVAEKKAKELGYNTFVMEDPIVGETSEAAVKHAEFAKKVLRTNQPVNIPACIISGGETTVTIKGDGKGGRNQEFVLAAAMEIEGDENIVILSGGTDGTDGPTDAAGAICDHRSVSRARELGVEPQECLRNNDSYHFFEKLDDLIITGPTKTNVMDIHLLIVDKAEQEP